MRRTVTRARVSGRGWHEGPRGPARPGGHPGLLRHGHRRAGAVAGATRRTGRLSVGIGARQAGVARRLLHLAGQCVGGPLRRRRGRHREPGRPAAAVQPPVPAAAPPGLAALTGAFSSPAIVRASSRRLNSSGSIPPGADEPPAARAAVKPSTAPSPALPPTWTDAKVKNRATAGQAMTARTRTSMPDSSVSMSLDFPVRERPTQKTRAMTGLRTISWAVEDASLGHHAWVERETWPAAAMGEVATRTAIAAFRSSISNHSTIVSTMPITAKMRSRAPWTLTSQGTRLAILADSACTDPNVWVTMK